MSKLDAQLIEARQRAERRAQELKPADEAHLGELLDRNVQREWYVITLPLPVFFDPPQTLAEVRKRYPGCKVEPKG